MTEILKFYITAIVVMAPLFIIVIRLIFKKSFLAKIGYVMIFVAILVTITTFNIEHFPNIPRIIGVPIRLLIVVGGIWFLRKDLRILQTISQNLREISNFNLNIKISETELKRKDEFGELSNYLQNMISQLSGMVNQVTENTSILNNTSESLLSASVNLAQNTNEQSATTEEISSSMEEMTATVEANTNKSKDTSKISTDAALQIEKNKELIIQTLKSVSEISEKITMISEIAEKTDILSINAAIEAARAGETGKGFAVVAQEIRKLADNTQIAAKEIEELSKNNRTISEISSKQLEKIIPQITTSAKMVNNIVVANQEQEQSINAINNAILQLTETTNDNSATAEEMSASAEELSVQAEQLKKLISVFKV